MPGNQRDMPSAIFKAWYAIRYMTERTQLPLLPDSLLHLGYEQTLHIPYNAEPPETYIITRRDEIRRSDETLPRMLTRGGIALINHLRLSDGHPILHDELLPYMSGRTRRSKIAWLGVVVNELNKGLFCEKMEEKPLFTDRHYPWLVRLRRAVKFIDERAAWPDDLDLSFRTSYAHLAVPALLPANLPPRESTLRGRSKPPYLPDSLGTHLTEGNTSLYYAYIFSLKYGPVESLRRTLLPLPTRERIAYEQLFPLPDANAPPVPASNTFMSALFNIPRGTLAHLAVREAKKHRQPAEYLSTQKIPTE